MTQHVYNFAALLLPGGPPAGLKKQLDCAGDAECLDCRRGQRGVLAWPVPAAWLLHHLQQPFRNNELKPHAANQLRWPQHCVLPSMIALHPCSC